MQNDRINPDDFRLTLQLEHDRTRTLQAAAASIAAHILVLGALAVLPSGWSEPRKETEVARRYTPLILPPELTQRAPNKGKVSKEFNAESEAPRARIHLPPSPPSTTRAAAPRSSPPPMAPPPTQPQAKVEPSAPPKLAPEDAQLAQQRVPPPAVPPPQQPQIQAQEQPPAKPKLAFENPGAGSGETKGVGRIAAPNPSVTEAVRGAIRGGSGRLAVGDVGADIGGIGEAINQPPSPGKQGSALELLSDPQGVDFRPYLVKILANVRRNWWAVMPESVKLGRRGKVAIQFAIARDGKVPKLVIVLASGADALDRAAVAGISASNPFPPLPSEFRGDQIRLQFTFLYNMPAN